MPSRSLFRAAAALAVFLAAGAAWNARAEAQVDETLVTKHWKKDTFWAETYDKPILTSRGHLDDTDDHIQIFHWNSQGRIKFDRKELEPPVWIGYRALTLSINAENEALHEVLHHAFADVAIAVAVPLGAIGDWSIIASAGIGTANDGRWDNTHALFPVATLEFSRRIGPNLLWHAGLSLDGNRGIAQEIPLPYLMLEATLDPSFTATVGFPKSEFTFRPFDPLLLSARWSFPGEASARIEAGLGRGWSVFAEADRRIDGFHQRNQERNRIFYEMNSAEVGVRWVRPWIDLSLSVGVAFGQRFFTGPDQRDRTPGSSVDNIPFIAITLPSTFWAGPF